MIWTAKDEDTVEQCRTCVANCGHYGVVPEAWFELVLRMHRELEQAGLLERERLEDDYCQGCVFEEGGCRRAYREAVLDGSRKRVVSCKERVMKGKEMGRLRGVIPQTCG